MFTRVCRSKSPDYRQFQFGSFSELKELLKGKILTSTNVNQASYNVNDKVTSPPPQ